VVDDRGSIRWGPLGVVVLAILTGVLVLAALQHPVAPGSIAAVRPGPVAPAESTGTAPSPQAAVSSTPPGPAERAKATRERPVALLTGNQAVRASPGSCPGSGAMIEVTSDAGQTWVPVETPSSSVLRVAWPTSQDLFHVGASDLGCTPEFRRSLDAGESWEPAVPPVDVWHLLPDPASIQLHAPRGVVDSPCGATGTYDLEPSLVGPAFVLCRDGRVFRSIDDAESWQAVGTERDAVALGVIAGEPLVAVVGSSTCEGVAIRPPGSADIGCVSEPRPAAGFALGFRDDAAGMLLAGDNTWVTSDAGQTWRSAASGG
jgi:hypothetical protein